MNLNDITARDLLSGVLVTVLVVGVAGLIYFAVAPVPATPGDTGFYVVSESGSAAHYPTNLSVGEEATVVVGIDNDEHQRTTYEFVVRAGTDVLDRRSVTIPDGEIREQPVTVSFDDPGEQRVAIRLYRGEASDGDPYRRLRLVFQVTPS